MMDMGATLCTKAKPACLLCPIQSDCIAHAEGRETFYPVKSKKAPNPTKYSLALRLQDAAGHQLWVKRPDNGIWGGLDCLPLVFLQKTQGDKVVQGYQEDKVFEQEYTTAEQIIFDFLTAQSLLDASKVNIVTAFSLDSPAVVKHGLTHFHWLLRLYPVTLNQAQADTLTQQLNAAQQVFRWVNSDDSQTLAQPKAMQLLSAVSDE